MIQMSGIQKWYSSRFIRTVVLQGIDLEVASGEFVSIMGTFRFGQIHVVAYYGYAGFVESRGILV